MWASGRGFEGNMTVAENGKRWKREAKEGQRRMLMVRRIDAWSELRYN
jgi:hypothetical protein